MSEELLKLEQRNQKMGEKLHEEHKELRAQQKQFEEELNHLNVLKENIISREKDLKQTESQCEGILDQKYLTNLFFF